MSRHVNCPTCGTKLPSGQPSPPLRTCTECHRSNPSGFDYCGFCASPLENTQLRARMSELAKPPGGWPNLMAELVEMRFYLQQGLLDDAYELLSILQRRHPGHPALEELVRQPKPSRLVDSDVVEMVDRVLAESVNLVARVPRRAAPQWRAPAAPGPERTQVHTVVPPDGRCAEATPAGSRKSSGSIGATSAKADRVAESPRGSAGSTGAKTPRAATSVPAQPRPEAVKPAEVSSAAPKAEPRVVARIAPSRASAASSSGPHAPPIVIPGSARARENTQVYGPNDPTPAAPPRTGHTLAVDALQPAKPFEEAEPAREAEAGKEPIRRRRKDGRIPKSPAGPAPVEQAPTKERENKEVRPRRVSFGEHVLNRLR